MNLGVDMDTFFRLLWRHVFTVEIIQRHYKITNEKEKTSAFQYIRQFFQADKKKCKALDYLDKWGCSFWEETENRIKEVTTKFENELQAAARVKIPSFSVANEATSRLTEEQK